MYIGNTKLHRNLTRTSIICARPVEQDAFNHFSQRGDWNEGPIDMDAINNVEWVDIEVYGDVNERSAIEMLMSVL